jgi:phosphate butyryltransferase
VDLRDYRRTLERIRTKAEGAQVLGEELTLRFGDLLSGVRPGAEDLVLVGLLGDEMAETVRRTGWNSLVLNPGSTSTEAAVYSGLRLVASSNVHLVPGEPDGVEERVRLVTAWLTKYDLSLSDLSGIAARGGFVAPLPTGTYRVSEEMVRDLERAPYQHAANIAVPMALKLGELAGSEVEITITDPVTCDEVDALYRMTGSAQITTDGTAAHYLNFKAICTLAGRLFGVPSEQLHLAICHMGGGISAARYCDGRVVQVMPGFGTFPAASRSGALPLKDVVRLMDKRAYGPDDLRRDVIEGGGGLLALAGTNDYNALLAFRDRGANAAQRVKIELLVDFYASRVAAGLLELSACERPLDAMVLSGALAANEDFCDRVTSRLHLPVPIVRVPGSIATQALAAGLLRTYVHPRSLRPYGVARDELAAQRREEDARLAVSVFERPLFRRPAGSPLRNIDDVIAAANPKGGELPLVAIVGGVNEEALLAAKLANHEGAPRLCRFVLLGPYGPISQLAWELDVPIDEENFLILDTEHPSQEAPKLLESGVVDTMMKGSVTTADLLRDYFRNLKARGKTGPGFMLSHIAMFELPGRPKLLGVTDAAITPYPDLEQRLRILENALVPFHLMGIERPKVAVISATEKASDKVISSVEGQEIARRMEGRDDLIIEGPISVDLALSPESAREKGYEGRIQGDADLLLAPNIDVGNGLYKAFTVTSGATVAASVIGGEAPLILTSRGDVAKTKLASIALTLVLARKLKERRQS